ncbi:MAG: chemotaxis protein CheB [Candidatus Dormibacteria bacterium]
MSAVPAKDILRVLIVSGQTGPWATQLARAVEADRDASVVAQVLPAQAVASIDRDHPDLVGLDMSGLSNSDQAAGLVREILALAPVPILLMVPSDHRRDASMAAVVAGAVEVMTYPARWDVAVGAELRKRLRALGHLSQRRRERLRRPPVRELRPAAAGGRRSSDGVVGLAASTGGPPALARVLAGLGGLQRPVIVVQHLQSGFVDGFLGWMRRESALPVELAVDGAPLRPGMVLVAPPGLHAIVRRGHRLSLLDEPVTLHRPSADVLFHSMADCGDERGIGVILTGMGDDGASGLLALRRIGGTTIAQDQESSAVYGMPKAAHDNGGVTWVLPLSEIAAAVLRAAGVAVPA